MARCGLKAALAALFLAAITPVPAAAQTLADVVKAVQDDGDDLFGSTELMSGSLKGLPQWNRVLLAMRADQPSFDRCADNAASCTTPVLKNWRKIIVSASKLPRNERLKSVNDFFNRWPYKEDRELYGLSEYWATPKEFMTRSGDCEDYSIAKYFALKELGFSKDEMRIVILMDEIRGIGHAVLAIYEKNEILVLDSLSNLILPHTRYKHYIPQYSMNESTRWAHIGSFKQKPKPEYRGLVARKP